jgi:two-component sensor histidine kinase
LVRAIIQPHESSAGNGASRFFIEGPSIRCGDNAVNGVALVVHELATNAAKYGALNVDEGRVDVNWQQRDGTLVLRWVERGGPPIEAPPATKGFGSKLTQTTIVRQFGGTLDYEWLPKGLAVTITVPVDSLAA